MVPTTTRATPALMIAFAQAGVLPLKLHGSKVTHRVDPRSFRPVLAHLSLHVSTRPLGETLSYYLPIFNYDTSNTLS